MHKVEGRLDLAIADYDAAIRLDPKATLAYHGRGRAHELKKDYARALADYNETLRLEPGKVGCLVDRGDVHRAEGRLDQAITDYNEAIRRDPKNVVAFNNRGVAFEVKADRVHALADYLEAIRIKPEYALAYRNCARVLRARETRPAPRDTASMRLISRRNRQRSDSALPRGDRAGAITGRPSSATAARWIGCARENLVAWMGQGARSASARSRDDGGRAAHAPLHAASGFKAWLEECTFAPDRNDPRRERGQAPGRPSLVARRGHAHPRGSRRLGSLGPR